ncbi:MAG: TIGR03960 family B12-binding radical SAM protein [Eggerthellaceae bacterium]|nr:TIGR03960 family B12-binding radical SAM protein [Eggerthellaceae bacterium]
MLKTDLWPQVAPLLTSVQKPARYIDHEWGAYVKKDADFQFCMVYPDTYEIGQANQALRILVNRVNAAEHLAAERAFLPDTDLIDLMRERDIPLFSMESYAPLNEFDVIGITLPHELCATNVLEVLSLSGIPLRSEERSEDDPIIIAGGPCAYNPEPFSAFFDAITIGEGEEVTPLTISTIRELRRQGKSRKEILRALAGISGTYVPSLYAWRDFDEAQEKGSWIRPYEDGLPVHITKRIYKGFATDDAYEPTIVPYMDVVHDRLNVEILRGCARGCRFCQAGMMYRPVRERSKENIVSAVMRGLEETGYDEVSLTSLSSTDHSQIEEILSELNDRLDGQGIKISIPSQRLDSFGVEMAALVAGQKKGGLTFAPEAGTQRLRDVINKNVTEEDLFGAIDAAFSSGWRRCKLYFMIGLPTETDEDVTGIAKLAEKAYERARKAIDPAQRGAVKFSISVAVFVPKAQTAFQWDGQIAPDETKRRIGLIRQNLRSRAIDLSYHEPKTSFVEAVMSRGGREVADWVQRAWELGARFDAWTEHFNEDAWRQAADEVGIDPEKIAQATYPVGTVMPWSHISCGVSPHFLEHERKKANMGLTTFDCSIEGHCSGCEACNVLQYKNELAGPRKKACGPEEG